MKEIRNLLMVIALAVAFVSCGGTEAENGQYGQQMDEQVAEQEEEQTGTAAEGTQQEETEVIDPHDMSDEEMVSWVMENCICPDCPSWVPEAGENGEGGYCKAGTSEYITEEVRCICGDCPVTEELGLQWGYYCTRGSAEEMMQQEQQSP